MSTLTGGGGRVGSSSDIAPSWVTGYWYGGGWARRGAGLCCTIDLSTVF